MSHPPSTPERAPAELCREAIRRLDAALNKPPAELSAEVDVAERTIVALRDALIGRRRQRIAAHGRATPDPTLDQVNVAVSLVVGLEYPVGGVERELLRQARSVLEALLTSSLG